jgi:hypothetical protein
MMANDNGAVLDVLKDILIVQGLAGVPQQQIQKIAGCSINRVNAIVKQLRATKKASGRSGATEG